jgi:hypothetical protein
MLHDSVGIQRLMPSCKEVLIENSRLLERSKVSNQIIRLRFVAIKWISYVSFFIKNIFSYNNKSIYIL